MKSLIIYIIALFSFITGFSQKYDSWEIFHNRKKVAGFNDRKQKDSENKILLLKRALDEPGFFIITYSPASGEQEDWSRSFAVCDSTDRELRRYNNMAQFKVLNSDIYGLIGSKQGVRIYSWALPRDADAAAAIRVRRILLCTIYTR